MSDLRPYWVSWWHRSELGPFELHSPWWISGSRFEGEVSVCAAVWARTARDARGQVLACYDTDPVTVGWRFVEEHDADWDPFSDRFPRAEWMVWERPEGD